MSVDIKYDIVAKMIENIFDLRFHSFRDDEEILDFCVQNKAIEKQSWLSLDAMKLILDRGHYNKISYFEDVLKIRIVLFYYNNKPIIIGPYLAEDMIIGKCIQLCNRIDKTNMNAENLLVYYGKYPVIPDSYMERIISSITDGLELGNPEEHYTIYKNEDIDEDSDSALTRISNENIEMHYCTERKYMDAIKKGSLREALHYKSLLNQNAASMWSVKINNDGRRQAYAVNRAMSRIAAYEAGVPAPIIHKITSKESTAIIAAQNERQMEEACVQMLRSFCEIIRTNNNKKYSALVQSIIYSVNQQYMDDLSIRNIANEIGISESYMIAQFKKETGMTPLNYLKKTRLEEAAKLLVSTDEEIQKVSSRVGIADANYFVKVFKSQYGVTPKVYRNSYRI